VRSDSKREFPSIALKSLPCPKVLKVIGAMEFTEIDGSQGEGGGQILRTAMSLAAILQKPIRISKIRAGRKEPGLRPQHLQSVLLASKISHGRLSGATLGSTEIEFEPGHPTDSFKDLIDTKTAGSITMIVQTIIPISIFRQVSIDVEIRGGTEVPNSPTIDYLRYLVIPIYEKLGVRVDLEIKQRGYYPKGGGIVTLKTSSTGSKPQPLILDENVESQSANKIRILSISRELPPHVARRQAESASKILADEGLALEKSDLDYSERALSPGSSILIYSNEHSLLVGSSSLGEKGKKAETVGDEAARYFINEYLSYPNVDSHLADMLVTLLCTVEGLSSFTTPFLTNHFITNAEIAKRMTNCRIDCQKEESKWRVSISGSPEKPN